MPLGNDTPVEHEASIEVAAENDRGGANQTSPLWGGLEGVFSPPTPNGRKCR
ncbi:hypothetical protein SAMN02927900_00228 [Rhizobium mongolense subsp. loessense]|uniref:Uncharacterized protein n=1 Tax=Rhizobium mongolense subsp. loessense TaxID=158890 RepID=A0A1G4PA66_9HYPH|nr:hypothetical protein SAMN02927900_00228 [Rhizobium mongolense subsp. loessense]